jgi:CBS domain-containing protein
MLGPAVTIKQRRAWTRILVLDLALVGVAGGGAFASLTAGDPALWESIAAGVGVALGFFAAVYVIELARLRITRETRPPGGISLSILGGIGVTRTEAGDSAKRLKIGALGSLLDVVTLSAAFGLGWSLRGNDSRAATILLVLAAAIGSCMVGRMLPILGLDGGRVLSGFAELLDSSDDGSQIGKALSYVTAVILLIGGVALILEASVVAYWGISVATAGMHGLSLSSWYERRCDWITRAMQTPAAEIDSTAYPTIIESAPARELLEIFAIEGAGTLVVVVDGRGFPVGVVQGEWAGRYLRRAQPEQPVQEIMTPLADLPHLCGGESAVEALQFIEGASVSLAVVRDYRGRARILSERDLNRFGR